MPRPASRRVGRPLPGHAPGKRALQALNFVVYVARAPKRGCSRPSPAPPGGLHRAPGHRRPRVYDDSLFFPRVVWLLLLPFPLFLLRLPPGEGEPRDEVDVLHQGQGPHPSDFLQEVRRDEDPLVAVGEAEEARPKGDAGGEEARGGRREASFSPRRRRRRRRRRQDCLEGAPRRRG